uniref:Arginine biosynthesis bifunctional protein ArgJ n=1 Tax=Thermodesulfovibrio aggregans TaxID=86166 RepID=A0A7C4AJ85_9BACT
MKIYLPKGFLYSVAKAGIKYPDRYDIALVYSRKPAYAAGVFTKNRIKAAPVKICIKRIKEGIAQALILNSGNANACTGEKGIEDALKVTEKVAEKLKINKKYVLPLSTGVIGMPMPMEKILPAIDEVVQNLGKAKPVQIAQAIMTTDKFPKITSRQIEISKKTVNILGICKGAGMISPNMATMLCIILTDASIDSTLMKNALNYAVSESFNLITVDGDMSTNDTVIMLANGESGSEKIGNKYWKQFRQTIHDICLELAQMIIKDAEGATKFITVNVNGAKKISDAKKVAKAVANSLLVKTAFYGENPNWGRIIAAAGYSGAYIKEEKIEIFINGICLFKMGLPTMREDELKDSLNRKNIEVLIDLNLGRKQSKVFTSDISEEYVRINSAYRT